jgi:hypothetical protein
MCRLLLKLITNQLITITMNTELIKLPINMSKHDLLLDLQHEGYTNIRYSGKLRGFFADK